MDRQTIDAAIAVIAAMVNDEQSIQVINKSCADIWGDFSPELQRMTPWIERNVVKFIDTVLGEQLASYFLYECVNMKEGGKIQEKCGKEWKLQSIENLHDYAYHIHGITTPIAER